MIGQRKQNTGEGWRGPWREWQRDTEAEGEAVVVVVFIVDTEVQSPRTR